MEDVTERNQVIRYQLMQLGRLVIDLNQERGNSALFNNNHTQWRFWGFHFLGGRGGALGWRHFHLGAHN